MCKCTVNIDARGPSKINPTMIRKYVTSTVDVQLKLSTSNLLGHGLSSSFKERKKTNTKDQRTKKY